MGWVFGPKRLTYTQVNRVLVFIAFKGDGPCQDLKKKKTLKKKGLSITIHTQSRSPLIKLKSSKVTAEVHQL